MMLAPLQYFAHGSNVTDLDPVLADRVGVGLNDPRLFPYVYVESGYRSYAEQLYLYREWKAGRYNVPSVARPGTSNHERGLAVDLATVGPSWATIRVILAEYGLSATVANEPWHFEITYGTRDIDMPLNQVDFDRIAQVVNEQLEMRMRQLPMMMNEAVAYVLGTEGISGVNQNVTATGDRVIRALDGDPNT